jgi:hypothetical protein
MSRMLDDLLGEIRRRFYARAPAQTFFADRRQILKALTWPAAWLRGHGFREEVTPAAYRRIVMDVLAKIQAHGAPPLPSEPNGYFPSYLLKCLQDHCRCGAEEVLADFKRLRDRVDLRSLVAAMEYRAAVPKAPVVDVLAEAHALLAKPRRRATRDRSQLPLL